MKTTLRISLSLSVSIALLTLVSSLAQDATTSQSSASKVGVAPDTSPTGMLPGLGVPAVTKRGASLDLIQTVIAHTNRAAKLTYRTNSLYVLGNGRNARNPNGNWVPATTGIELTQTGAQAIGTYHKAYFDADIASSPTGAVHLVTGDGKHLRARLAFLAYFEPETGRSTIISEVTNSIGIIDPSEPNRVTYTNVLDGDVIASARYTVSKAGLEQDLLLLSPIPPPDAFSLTNKCRLELWTEMFPSEPPKIISAPRPGSPDETVDRTIKLGEMALAPGFAFPLRIGEDRRLPLSTKRSWRVIDGRSWLVEDIEYDLIEPYLRKLGPPRQASHKPTHGSVRYVVSKKRLFPRPRPVADVSGARKRITIASIPKQPAFAMDWNAVTPTTDLHLLADSTYSIESNTVVWCDGNTVIEGGTVLKFQKDATLAPIGTVECRTGPYRPAIFTSVFDNSVGESISNSAPVSPWLWTGIATWGGLDAKYLYFHNANVGITAFADFRASHCQFIHCNRGIWAEYASFSVRNCLFYDVTNAFYGTEFTGAGQNLTIDQATALTEDFNGSGLSSVALTNSLISNVPSDGNASVGKYSTFTVANNEIAFQPALAGFHYLTNGSVYRNAATEPIDADLQADLQKMTTYAPIVLSNQTLTVDTPLSPRALLDTNGTDIGAHYAPLDYVFSGDTLTNAAMTLGPGTAIGVYPNIYGYALRLEGSGSFTASGTADNPVRIAQINAVQEDPPPIQNRNFDVSIMSPVNSGAGTAQCSFNFVKSYCIAADGNHVYGYTHPAQVLQFKNSEFYGGGFYNEELGMTFTNCLFNGVSTYFGEDYNPFPITLANSLFYGGSLTVAHEYTNEIWVLRDNAFDRTDFENFGDYALNYEDYNAFIATTNPFTAGAHDLFPTNLDWQVGPLGDFYQLTNSPLINVGSTNANLVALYHYTTSTNLVPGIEIAETNSVVDIGYHYVAVDSGGAPLDSDGDGLANYIEDVNSDGVFDAGDLSNWSSTDTDGDGVSDFIEILQGRNPKIAGTTADTGNQIKLQVYTPLN